MSNSLRPHRRQPTRLCRPWDSPGKNTGVSCHFLLQCMKVKSESEVAQSCPTFSNPMDCSPPGSSVHGIFQARVLEWGAIAFSAAALKRFLNCSGRAGGAPSHVLSGIQESSGSSGQSRATSCGSLTCLCEGSFFVTAQLLPASILGPPCQSAGKQPQGSLTLAPTQTLPGSAASCGKSASHTSAHQGPGPLYENSLLGCCRSMDKRVRRQTFSQTYRTIGMCLVSSDAPLFLLCGGHGAGLGW